MKWFILLTRYIVLPFTITSSALLTYGGLISISPNPSEFVKFIYVILIIAYAAMIYLFWELLGKFIRSTKNIVSIILIPLLSSIVLVLIFSTSTIFNIIYISGMIAVDREISYKTLLLKTKIQENIENQKSLIDNKITHLKRFIKTTREYQKVESETGKEVMYYIYKDLDIKMTSIHQDLKKKHALIKKQDSNTLEIIDDYLEKYSSGIEQQIKDSIHDGAVSLALNTLEEAEEMHSPETSYDENRPRNSTLPITKQYFSASNNALGFVSSIKNISTGSVEYRRREYNQLISVIHSIMMKIKSQSNINIQLNEELYNFIDERKKQLDSSKYNTQELITRKQNLNYLLNEIQKNLINEKSQSREMNINYNSYKSKDIISVVFDPRFRELPLVTFAFFIDYVPILLVLLSSAIYRKPEKPKEKDNG